MDGEYSSNLEPIAKLLFTAIGCKGAKHEHAHVFVDKSEANLVWNAGV